MQEHEALAAGERTRRVMDHVTGGWRTQVVAALARFGVADQLANGPRDVAALAQSAGAAIDPFYRLLRAGASLGILVESPARTFALAEAGMALREGAPGSVRNLAIMIASPGHWRPWERLEEAARTGKTQTDAALGADIWAYYRDHGPEGEIFSKAMAEMTGLLGDELAEVYDASWARLAVDVGGGVGSLLASLLRKYPETRGIVFDQPQLGAAAGAYLARAGVSDRVAFVAGDFFADVPTGGDLYVLKHILHDWDDARCVTLLTHCSRAALPHARLLVVEMPLDADRPDPMTPLLDLNMLLLTGGRERTAAEYESLLKRGGWRLQRAVQAGMMSALEAVRA
ncbi:MAG TPA: methyltransferase [Planctomycetota bacterium]|nr:methyltransferase [Planctomycetota bacterium]